MTTGSKIETSFGSLLAKRNRGGRLLAKWGSTLWLGLIVGGCQTQAPPDSTKTELAAASTPVVVLREGDMLKIAFPGSPNLDTTQKIRVDGKITLPLIGETQAAGMTDDELQRDLAKLYAQQLSSKEVTVTVESSTFPVFVTGCVIHPGKISSDHPITVLEAIMEAGGFDYSKANLKAVRVLRHEKGVVENYSLNLKLVLDGRQNQPFYLRPSDIVYVPERFSWF